MEPQSNKMQRKDEGGNCSGQPTKRKQRKHFYIYGNYHTYYGYRIDQALDEDPRMKVLKNEWFEGRDCLDIGCNEGFITISIAQKFACRSILGIDIDDRLIGRARQNLKAMAGVEEDGETIKQFAEEIDRVNKLDDADRMEQSNGNEDGLNESEGTEREEQLSEDATNELGGADSGSLRDEASQLLRASGLDNLADDKDRLNELEGMDMKGQSFEYKDVTKDLGGADSRSSRDEASQLLRGSGSDNVAEDKDRVNELEGTDMKGQSFEDKNVTKDLKCTYRRFFRHGTRQMSRDSGSDNIEGKFKDPDLLKRVHFRTENFIQKFPSVLDATYDTVLCLSVTKWVHLNWGDEGLICLFAKIWQIMRPGGILLLEPQPWKSYERKRLVSEVAVENFREIVFKPDAFRDILLDKIGFRSMEMISTHVPNSTAGFNRPIYLLWK
jgi:SAM-dependent methyltransferase